jgi:4-phosphopantoate--beta-alanine ligase
MKISKTHPRYESLKYRHKLVEGLKKGYVTQSGLISHGRGEAFDYLIGEKTIPEAWAAEKAAVSLLLLSKDPVLSVNGNTAALCPKELVDLAGALDAKLEVNLYYRTLKREKLIEKILKKNGAGEVYGVGVKANKRIPKLDSDRSKVDSLGIWSADAVLVPLEDGDRVESLVAMGKKIVSIDLNPLSRTSQKASVAIVDNVVRAAANMITLAADMKEMDRDGLQGVLDGFNNCENLEKTIRTMRQDIRKSDK